MLALLPLLLHHSVDLALYVSDCVVAALGYRRHGSAGWLLIALHGGVRLLQVVLGFGQTAWLHLRGPGSPGFSSALTLLSMAQFGLSIVALGLLLAGLLVLASPTRPGPSR